MRVNTEKGLFCLAMQGFINSEGEEIMKVRLYCNKILIVGETQFEEDYLDEIAPMPDTAQFEAFIKTGLEVTNKLGLMLVRKEVEEKK